MVMAADPLSSLDGLWDGKDMRYDGTWWTLGDLVLEGMQTEGKTHA